MGQTVLIDSSFGALLWRPLHPACTPSSTTPLAILRVETRFGRDVGCHHDHLVSLDSQNGLEAPGNPMMASRMAKLAVVVLKVSQTLERSVAEGTAIEETFSGAKMKVWPGLWPTTCLERG